MRRLLLAATLLALLPQSPARAYTVLADISCAGILEEDASPDFAMANLWWVLGYLTGRNAASGDHAGALYDDEEIYDALLDFCFDHPDASIADAGQHLFETLW